MYKSKDSRTQLLVKNVAASFFIRGWSAVVVLLMVPLTLKILGVYSNGVWLTISSVLIWLDFMDIGLGSGLRNAVATYVANGEHEKVRQAVSSTFFMLFIIVIPILLLLYLIIWEFNIYSFFSVDEAIIPNLKTILTVAVTFASSNFVLKSVGSFYQGLQLPAVNNLIVCIGQTFALLLTFAAYCMGVHSLLWVVAINTMAPPIIWAASMPYTFLKKYSAYRPSIKHIDFKMSLQLCSQGVQFFIIHICGVVLFMTTNLIISKLFSPADVTPYQIAYRYIHIVFVIFSTICIPFWSATTDAYSRGDVEWLHKSSQKLDLLMVGVMAALLLLILISNFVYKLWIGNDVTIPMDLTISVAIYIFILSLSQRYSYILNGLGILKIQLIFSVSATILYLPIAWYVCKTFNTVTSLVYVMCLINTPGMIANMWKYKTIINKLRRP